MADLVDPKEIQASDASELSLARNVARGLPVVTVLAGAAVGVTFSAGPAILVLCGGALLGAIALIWASVRSLGGDAPLAAGLHAVVARGGTSALEEQKATLLRALKDLEMEHALGKLDASDYEQVAARYRQQAKDVLRQIDEEVAPLRARAEKIASSYLARKSEAKVAAAPPATPEVQEGKVICASCETENEADAVFCKKCGQRARPEEGGDAEG